MRIDDVFEEITLLDEEGQPVQFDHVMTFLHEKEKYIALLPLEPVENVGEDEVVLLRVVAQAGEDRYETIQNPVLLDEVFAAFLEQFDQMQDELDDEDERD